jgi:hypothetical protein
MKQMNNNHDDEVIPLNFYLSQNHPNPFRNKTTIKYCIAFKTRVRITVFNLNGNLIDKLVDEEQEAGTYKIDFSVENRIEDLKSGIYIYELKTESYSCKKKMIFQI